MMETISKDVDDLVSYISDSSNTVEHLDVLASNIDSDSTDRELFIVAHSLEQIRYRFGFIKKLSGKTLSIESHRITHHSLESNILSDIKRFIQKVIEAVKALINKLMSLFRETSNNKEAEEAQKKSHDLKKRILAIGHTPSNGSAFKKPDPTPKNFDHKDKTTLPPGYALVSLSVSKTILTSFNVSGSKVTDLAAEIKNELSAAESVVDSLTNALPHVKGLYSGFLQSYKDFENSVRTDYISDPTAYEEVIRAHKDGVVEEVRAFLALITTIAKQVPEQNSSKVTIPISISKTVVENAKYGDHVTSLQATWDKTPIASTSPETFFVLNERDSLALLSSVDDIIKIRTRISDSCKMFSKSTVGITHGLEEMCDRLTSQPMMRYESLNSAFREFGNCATVVVKQIAVYVRSVENFMSTYIRATDYSTKLFLSVAEDIEKGLKNLHTS